MAYTKVFAIRARLDDRVKYAVNAEKTELNEKIGYAADFYVVEIGDGGRVLE